MSAVSQVWCGAPIIQNPTSFKRSPVYSSQREQSRSGQGGSKVSLGPKEFQERHHLLQNSTTEANTIEQQDRSLAVSTPAAFPEVIRSDNLLIKKRVTLARLVKGVYELEYRRLVGISFEESPPARSWWESVSFDLVDEFELESVLQQQDRSIDLVVYKWNNSTASLDAPCQRVVIAIRGTLPSMEDGWHNLHGSLQCLHLTPRFRQILEVVKRTIAAHGSSDDICITGHSLGAALGLLVARTLATEEGIQIESHLFNPIYAYTWIPTSDDLLDNEELWRTVRTMRCVTVAGLANILMDDESRVKIFSEYSQLEDWTPHIYINTGDPICRGYWEYFSSHERLARNGAMGAYLAHLAAPFSGRGLLTSVLGSKPSHLIPSAMLHVCEGEPPTWPGTDVLTDRSRYASHNLGTWMLEELPVHSREVKLSSW